MKLRTHQALDADPEVIHKINLTGYPNYSGNAQIFVILEKTNVCNVISRYLYLSIQVSIHK